MNTDSKYNLSLLGDLNSKLVAIVAGIVCFSTFIQSFLNQIHFILGVSFEQAYYLFIFLYFILPAIAISYFSYKTIYRLDHRSGNYRILFSIAKLPFLLMLLAIPLLMLLALLICFPHIYIIALTLVITVAGITLLIFAAVMQAHRQHLLNSREAIEYFGSILIAVVIGALFFASNIKTLGQKELTNNEVLTLYASNSKLKEKVAPLVKKINNSYDNALNKTWSLELLRAVKTEKYSGDDKFLAPVIQNKELQKILTETSFLLRHKHSLIDSFRDSSDYETCFININNRLKDYEESVSELLSSRHFYEHTVEVAAFKQSIADFKDVTKVISSSLGSLIAHSNEKLKTHWLTHIRYLQYASLLLFFTTLVLLFTLLFFLRLKLRQVNEKVITTGFKRPGYFSNLRKHFVLSSAQSSKSDDESKAIENAGNTAKNLILLILLLAAPYFRHYTEENINLDKPFVNISLSDIVDDNLDGRHTNYRSVDTAKGGRDAFGPIVIMDGGNLLVPEDSLNAETVVDRQEEILRNLKNLGIKAIDDPKDRKEYIDSFDSLYNKKNKP